MPYLPDSFLQPPFVGVRFSETTQEEFMSIDSHSKLATGLIGTCFAVLAIVLQVGYVPKLFAFIIMILHAISTLFLLFSIYNKILARNLENCSEVAYSLDDPHELIFKSRKQMYHGVMTFLTSLAVLIYCYFI